MKLVTRKVLGIRYAILFLILSVTLMGCEAILIRVEQFLPTGEAKLPGKIDTPTLLPFTSTPILTQTQLINSTLTVETSKPCLLAEAASPFDITVVDGTRFYPGEVFSKTWRLLNSGSCSWTPDFVVTWFYGDQLSLIRSKTLNTTVNPGGEIDITLEMVAPEKPGSYKSFWKLSNPQGELFGIGPNGDSAFWVSIEVIEPVTATPTIEPSATPTESIYIRGIVSLVTGNYFDLDTGDTSQAGGGDVILQYTTYKGLSLYPVNNTMISHFGSQPPSLKDCLAKSDYNQDPVLLVRDQVLYQYFCIISDQNLPAYIYIRDLDTENNQLEFDYLVWSIP